MKLNTTTKKLFSLTLVPGFIFCSAADAAPILYSQTCELNHECPIPGEDGGQTHFNVSPNTGLSYSCEVKSQGGSLKFAVSSGKNFKITHGDGLYNANPTVAIDINGRFKKPDDPNNIGEIRFTKLPPSADGSVKCVAKS